MSYKKTLGQLFSQNNLFIMIIDSGPLSIEHKKGWKLRQP